MADTTKSLEGKTALVTGATGSIGAHLVRALRMAGASVHGTWRRSPPDSSFEDANRWWRVDLRNGEEVDRLVGEVRPDVVFHLASHVSGARSMDGVLPTFQDNLVSTLHLLLAISRQQPCRLVLAGSMEDPAKGGQENYSSPYSAAKAAARGYARMFHSLYDVPVSVARIFMVYGPAQRDVTKLVPYSILRLLKGDPPEISSGVRKVDWIYVDDVVSGLMAIAARGSHDGGTVDIGTGTTHTVGEVVEEICRQVDPSIHPKIGAVSDRPMEQEPVANVSATRDEIGWTPTVTLREGIAHTISWYRNDSTG